MKWMPSFCAALALSVAFACVPGTGGRMVMVDFALEALPHGEAPLGVFTTDTGWSVVLTEAKLALGPVYLIQPELALRALLGPPLARAHGGLDPLSGRRVLAEWLAPTVVDALAPSRVRLGTVDAEGGRVGDAELRLDRPRGIAVGILGDHHAWVSGIATKEGAEIVFEGGLVLPDDGLVRRVEGVQVDGTLDDGATVVIGVLPSRWLDGARFELLAPPDESGVSSITAADQVRAALFLGVRAPDAYHVTIAGGAP